MGGVTTGFVTFGAIIALGYVLAYFDVIDATVQRSLVRITFLVANPALLIHVLSGADVHTLLSANLVSAVVSIVVAAATYLVIARLWWRPSKGETVIGALSASFVNSGNLGLPIAAYRSATRLTQRR